MTNIEKYKVETLRRRFTIDIDESDFIKKVTLSNRWKFLGTSLEEALDNTFRTIVREHYQNDSDVQKDYEKGRI